MNADDDERVAVDVHRGQPTADELAAVIAVVSAAYTVEATEARAPRGPARARWEVSARGLRAPLQRENGWGGFAG